MSNAYRRVGELVALDFNHLWDAGEFNPVTCMGVVTEVGTEGNTDVSVLWDSGVANIYQTDGDDLIPISYATRRLARTAARRNPNLTIAKVETSAGHYWVLVMKQRMLYNDMRQPIS